MTLTTETVLEAFQKYPDHIIPFCQCDVRKPDVLKRIRAYHEAGCRGFGEQKEHVPFGDPRLERVIALCDELDWPMVIHFQGRQEGLQPGPGRPLGDLSEAVQAGEGSSATRRPGGRTSAPTSHQPRRRSIPRGPSSRAG